MDISQFCSKRGDPVLLVRKYPDGVIAGAVIAVVGSVSVEDGAGRKYFMAEGAARLICPEGNGSPILERHCMIPTEWTEICVGEWAVERGLREYHLGGPDTLDGLYAAISRSANF